MSHFCLLGAGAVRNKNVRVSIMQVFIREIHSLTMNGSHSIPGLHIGKSQGSRGKTGVGKGSPTFIRSIGNSSKATKSM